MLMGLIGRRCPAQTFKSKIEAHRRLYKAELISDAHGPLKKDDLKHIRFYDPDSAYCVPARATRVLNAPVFQIAVFTGQAQGQQYMRYAVLEMTLNGKPISLTVYRNMDLASKPDYVDYLFLPFTDLTNGNETYAGGRYIDLREKDFKDNVVMIDFNKAYNPYCAFGGNYVCPKPPDENRVPMPVKAGEKIYGNLQKH